MKRFKLLNNTVGWIVCAIACAVYLMTIEPTASFWDCGEFIATSYKMEIGHPPGAPFFMMLGRICSLFASDPSHVAAMVNSYSAVCSGLTILFLFWTITHIVRRMEVPNDVFKNGGEVSLGTTIAILGAGAVGALAYTFSDTFWFSAVEGEVYASSSLFTAVVYWCILKWEDCADEPYANRWLVLIAYLMGLSIGVHLLNLLSIPVLVLVYYYRKNENPTTKGALIALGISCFILACILYGLIPGFAQVAGWFELIFVNGLGCPYNTGVVIYAIALIGALVWGILLTSKNGVLIPKSANATAKSEGKKITYIFVVAIILLGIPFFGAGTGSHLFLALVLIGALIFVLTNYADKVQMPLLNTVLLCCMMVLLGYSTYAPLVIRSAANPTMDENSPDDVFALKSYLNREQYGDRPLIYGETYASQYQRDENGAVVVDEGEPLYAKAIKNSDAEPDNYVLYDHHKDYKHDAAHNMLFPRMYSTQPSHVDAYKEWGGQPGRLVDGQPAPSQWNNMVFFSTYQVGFMYFRYFMWNFVGRENDIQGNGEVQHGNWCSGIPFIDNLLCGGNYNSMPDSLKNNKGHNCYFFLPLILGILGILYQFDSKHKYGMQSFWQVLILFLLTGLAIVVYLNQTPYQPRERDYAYAGSFYAFAIWIGLGVMFFHSYISRYLNAKVSATIATLACLGVPTLMAQQNWDDHDRSNRYTCRDFGGDYLRSLAPNAIVFTNGDNDTFPLWYNQEVEGDCKDDSLKVQYQNKRVANLSYLQMGWYVAQMTRDAYDSKGVTLSMKESDYSMGRLDVVYVNPNATNEMSVQDAINNVVAQQNKIGLGVSGNDNVVILPSCQLYLDVDSTEVVANGFNAARVHEELDNFRKMVFKGNYDQIVANPTMSVAEKNAKIAEVQKKVQSLKKYRMYFDLSKKRYLGKHELFILDLLANNHWKRPIYYAVTVGGESKLGLERYFQLEGLAYRVMPYTCAGASNTKVMYDNMMRKFEFGNASDPNVYLEENNQRMCGTFRNMFAMLAADLYQEGKRDSCKKVLDYALTKLPSATIPMGRYDMGILKLYYELGDTKTADKYASEMVKDSRQYVEWFSSLRIGKRRTANLEFSQKRELLQVIGGMLQSYGRKELAEECMTALKNSEAAYNEVVSTVNPNMMPQYDEEEE